MFPGYFSVLCTQMFQTKYKVDANNIKLIPIYTMHCCTKTLSLSISIKSGWRIEKRTGDKPPRHPEPPLQGRCGPPGTGSSSSCGTAGCPTPARHPWSARSDPAPPTPASRVVQRHAGDKEGESQRLTRNNQDRITVKLFLVICEYHRVLMVLTYPHESLVTRVVLPSTALQSWVCPGAVSEGRNLQSFGNIPSWIGRKGVKRKGKGLTCLFLFIVCYLALSIR